MRRVSFTTALVAGCALGVGLLQGCSKPEPAQPATGSAPAAATATAPTAAPAAPPAAPPAEAVASGPAGTWHLDNQVVKDEMMATIAGIEDPEERQVMEFGMEMMGASLIDEMQMILTLNPDGSATSTTSLFGESDTVHGTWTADGDLLTIEMEQEGESDAVLARLDGDSLELIPPEGEELPFRMIMRRQAN